MNILQEADEITSGARQDYYGHPAENHGNTSDFWSAYIKRKYGAEIPLNGRDVCMMMALLKISRDANRPTRDNLTDVAGYVRNAEMIEAYATDTCPTAPQPCDGGPDGIPFTP